MERGIVFYIAGFGINYLIPTALLTLRRHYKGPICFITDPGFSPIITALINELPDTFCIEDELRHGLGLKRIDLWCRKAYHHIDQYPFDVNLYYDLDHIWMSEFDYSIFDLIEKHGLVCTSANNTPGQCSRKKREAEKCIGEKLPFFHAINGGCAGAVKKSDQAYMWTDMISKTYKNNYLHRNPEEFAMCILKAQGHAGTASYHWSMPINSKFIKDGINTKNLNSPLAIHCVRGTFNKLKMWRDICQEALENDFMGFHTYYTEYNKAGNKTVQKLYRGIENVRNKRCDISKSGNEVCDKGACIDLLPPTALSGSDNCTHSSDSTGVVTGSS